MRKLVVLLAIVALFAVPAYAEVQNVKVSGDITLRALHRTGINLGGTVNEGADMFFMNTARIKVDADLTDNVSTCVRIVNEKDWGRQGASAFDVDADLAYMTLKEFLYQPLTLTLGRQPVVLGKGFILGNNVWSWDPNVAIGANEYSSFTAFDGIRAFFNDRPLPTADCLLPAAKATVLEESERWMVTETRTPSGPEGEAEGTAESLSPSGSSRLP